MATFVITNISSEQVHLTEFYKTMDPGDVLTLNDRSSNEIPDLRTTMAAFAAGDITFEVTYDADELPFAAPPNAIEAQDIQEVPSTDVAAAILTMYSGLFAAGGGGADDVTIYAADGLPYKFRLLNAWALVSTAVGGATLELRDEAAGAGNLLATMSGAVLGYQPMTDQLTAVAAPGTLKGLFLRRSDNGVAGEVIALVRREE